jgi:UDP:flavonoid glycosyltransferase YjiC (YdhE family)
LNQISWELFKFSHFSFAQDLEDFISAGSDMGFIYVSMGSSVKAANMPEHLRQLLIHTFARLPYRVLWKYESNVIQNDLPPNVKISRWLPQQDILGHKKLKVFITHGGLLSMYETVYHAAPAIVMPVFCDHDSNSEKAATDGYGGGHFFLSLFKFFFYFSLANNFHFFILSIKIAFGDSHVGAVV